VFPLFADEETSSLLVCLQLNHTPGGEEMLDRDGEACYA
jgi:hypothetical protein